jgi:hypothetical protein
MIFSKARPTISVALYGSLTFNVQKRRHQGFESVKMLEQKISKNRMFRSIIDILSITFPESPTPNPRSEALFPKVVQASRLFPKFKFRSSISHRPVHAGVRSPPRGRWLDVHAIEVVVRLVHAGVVLLGLSGDELAGGLEGGLDLGSEALIGGGGGGAAG